MSSLSAVRNTEEVWKGVLKAPRMKHDQKESGMPYESSGPAHGSKWGLFVLLSHLCGRIWDVGFNPVWKGKKRKLPLVDGYTVG